MAALGATQRVPDAPATPRIVSLSAQATRFLVALGVGARIVAVDPASRALPGFERHPTTSLSGADRFDPSWILIPRQPQDPADLAALTERGITVVEFAPHDLEEVFALLRTVGYPLVGEEEATQLERQIARPMALVAGESSDTGRPRVVAVVEIEPLTIAGGHSFETDLIQAAGGTSATHGSDDTARRVARADLARLAPDLLLVVTPNALSSPEQDRVAHAIGDLAPVAFFVYDRDDFWLEDTGRESERLRELIAEFREPVPAAERPRDG